ncbi:uncharacterized protein LOC143154375 [Ptiloglossa arizonensis]|uniref:uncharacterized protein LOC143154375 n=1 Tax=Ptiloglossa arizonensis TaxID=3350558 RepID=UPI003F9FD90D
MCIYILSLPWAHAHSCVVHRDSFLAVVRDWVDCFLYAFWLLCLCSYGCNFVCFNIDPGNLAAYELCILAASSNNSSVAYLVDTRTRYLMYRRDIVSGYLDTCYVTTQRKYGNTTIFLPVIPFSLFVGYASNLFILKEQQ